MGLAFVIFFPLGAIIIRFLGKLLPVPVQLHYGVQIFSIVAVLAAMALGVQASIGMQFINFRNPPLCLPTSDTSRPKIRHYYHRLTPHSTLLWMVPPPPIRVGSTLLASLVHTRPSLARTSHHPVWSRKLWIRVT